MNIITEIAWHSLLLFLWGGGIAAICVGAGLLVFPAKIDNINHYLSRWIDTEKMEAELDRPRKLERFIYRHHRWFGAALLGASVFIIHAFLIRHIGQQISKAFPKDVLGLLDAGVAILVIGGVIGALIGLIMFSKPSLVRELEAASNRWVSTAWLSDLLNRSHLSFDGYIRRRRKLFGVMLTSAGFYIVCRLGAVLFMDKWHF